MLQKVKDFFQNKELLLKIALSIAVTATIVFSIFYFEISIDTFMEFTGPVEINVDVTTTINLN